jgi:catechol 2,3-dioxygenase-like lactoylglutathione lyase family enzyme
LRDARYGHAVQVLRLCWLGIPAREYQATVGLFRDVMGLPVEFSEPTTTELSLPSGDRVQVFAPDDPYFEFFAEHARGPVALFEVSDLDDARADLVSAGVEIVGEAGRDSAWTWLHFRGPDGHLYELAERLEKPA